MASLITTHVLDTSVGKPAEGVAVTLELQQATGDWNKLSEGTTNADGRVNNLLPDDSRLAVGTYRLTFHTAEYFDRMKRESFYPKVAVEFEVKDGGHHHVPLLLNPFGYSTYRGS